MSHSKIRKFYENQNVFVTGGTGFMGKILIEKLLRSTNVSTIYVLIRNKKGKTVNARLEEILQNELFNTVKKHNPNFQSRVRAVHGDSALPNLALSKEDREELILKVNIVFNVAATVRFDESLKDAYGINVGGTENVIKLCKSIRNLKSCVHVSTAYSNCHVNRVEETFYDYLDHKHIKSVLEESSSSDTNELTSKIVEEWPNTYAFTKALAEIYIRENAQDLPVGIFRPAIVSATHKEPLEGWIDNYGGATSVFAGLGLGFVRVVPLDVNLKAELVPVDMSIAALISIAWDVTERRYQRSNSNIPIYNYVSSIDNPLTWMELIQLLRIQFLYYPLSSSIWKPEVVPMKKSEQSFSFLQVLYHYVPAALIDFKKLICFEKPQMISKYIKADGALDRLRFVTDREWNFTNSNVRSLWNKMDESDREIFPFDLTRVHWVQYIRNYYKGVRVYMFKDPLDTIPKAKIKAERFQLAHWFLSLIFYYLGTNVVWIIVQKLVQIFIRLFRSQT